MTIGFSIKAWNKLTHGDVILAVNDDNIIVAKVDGTPTETEIFAIDRNGAPTVLLKSDGWDIKIRKLS